MTKTKTVFYCANCGNQSPKWVGKCPSCNQWNTFVEEVIERKKSSISQSTGVIDKNIPTKIQDVSGENHARIQLIDNELNTLLGGGLVPGSLILFGGEPGIGKSTLLLQLALKQNNLRVLYVSGEESMQQIKMRGERIGIESENCFLLSETYIPSIIQQIVNVQPNLVIIDSIQTMYTSSIESSPGTVSQIRESTHELLQIAKKSNVPIFLVGHITKDGQLAGPKVLEHMVDTVLHFEGDRNYVYRILRSNKNRFGSTNDLAIYEMHGNGLKEVANPSKVLLTQRDEPLSGIAIASVMEGMRPMMIEIQALVGNSAYGTPQRSATGFDNRRLSMLLAVLEKKCGFNLSTKDVFVNIAGGIKVNDPSIDLAIVIAIISSAQDIPVEPTLCFSAELGLSGEIRPVSRIESRIKEAEKMGFTGLIISSYNEKIGNTGKKLTLIERKKIEDVFRKVFA